MMQDAGSKPTPPQKNVLSQAWTRISQGEGNDDFNYTVHEICRRWGLIEPWQIYQGYLDSWTPHMKGRWVASAVLLCAFVARIVSQQSYTGFLDSMTPYTRGRWFAAALFLLAFVCRIVYAQGWYIITYALGIYHLNLFIAFLTPKIDPAMDFDAEEEGGPALPTRVGEEFRPFIRRLPEFKFWLSVTKSTIFATGCTFFDCFNIPVFWPILVMYFITLLCITMKRQIKHMIKYRYLPFTHNKPKYQSTEVN